MKRKREWETKSLFETIEESLIGDTTGAYSALNIINLGTDFNERVGSSVYNKSLEVRLKMRWLVKQNMDPVRVVIFNDRQPPSNDDPPLVGEILNDDVNVIISPIRYSQRRRFDILVDEVIENPQTTGGEVPIEWPTYSFVGVGEEPFKFSTSGFWEVDLGDEGSIFYRVPTFGTTIFQSEVQGHTITQANSPYIPGNPNPYTGPAPMVGGGIITLVPGAIQNGNVTVPEYDINSDFTLETHDDVLHHDQILITATTEDPIVTVVEGTLEPSVYSTDIVLFAKQTFHKWNIDLGFITKYREIQDDDPLIVTNKIYIAFFKAVGDDVVPNSNIIVDLISELKYIDK